MFSSIFALALILLVWFKTRAFVEYCSLFRLTGWTKVGEFKEMQEEQTEPLDYIDFLKTYYNNFLVRLITCPICLACWLGIPLSIPFPLAYPAVVFLGLFSYFLTVKVMKNESSR